jgi:protein-S-isoprenylcysteine O-methyltransferase Ste14
MVLILVFLINYFLYWIIFFRSKDTETNFWKIYKKIYDTFWTIPLITIPILNSGFFTEFNNQESYFRELWIWFLVLGIIFVIVGIKLETMFKNKREYKADGKTTINIKGVFEIMRHPKLTFWAIIFLGLAFIFDSFLSLLFAPFLVLLLELQAFLEEKYIFFPKYGQKRMNSYKKKTPFRIFPRPYNALLILIAIFVIYTGVMNFLISN